MGRLSSNRHRRQDAVLWGMVGVNKFNRPVVAPPIPLKVRWVEEVKLTGSTQDEVIMTEVTVEVDRIIPIGSIMWYGHISTLPDPVGKLDFYKVSFRETIPNLKNTERRYTVFLSRYSQTLPDVSS